MDPLDEAQLEHEDPSDEDMRRFGGDDDDGSDYDDEAFDEQPDRWDRLSARKRQAIITVGLVLGLAAMLWLMIG